MTLDDPLLSTCPWLETGNPAARRGGPITGIAASEVGPIKCETGGLNHPGFDEDRTRWSADAPRASTHRLFIVNDENQWEIAGSYQIARCVKVPGRSALSVGNGHGWKASFAKAGVAVSAAQC